MSRCESLQCSTQTNSDKKYCKHYRRVYCCFSNHFCTLSQCTVQLTIKVIPFKMNCGISVGWKNYCVHFVCQHAYITLILFQSHSSVLLQATFQKALKAYLKSSSTQVCESTEISLCLEVTGFTFLARSTLHVFYARFFYAVSLNYLLPTNNKCTFFRQLSQFHSI